MVGLIDGRTDVPFGFCHRVIEGFAGAEQRSESGRQGAAGAMGVDVGGSRRGESHHALARDEDVDGILIITEVATFQQGGAIEAIEKFRGRFGHIRFRFDFSIEQGFSLGQIGSGDVGQRQNALPVDFDRGVIEQSVSGGGNHDRIDHQSDACVRLICEEVSGDLGELEVCQHAGFDARDRIMAGQNLQLTGEHFRLDDLHAVDHVGHFGNDGGDGANAVATVGGNGFQIGLQAGAGTAVGTGDGEDDGWGSWHG